MKEPGGRTLVPSEPLHQDIKSTKTTEAQVPRSELLGGTEAGQGGSCEWAVMPLHLPLVPNGRGGEEASHHVLMHVSARPCPPKKRTIRCVYRRMWFAYVTTLEQVMRLDKKLISLTSITFR